jgi:hypothetical protein
VSYHTYNLLGKEAARIRVPRDFKPLLDNLSASFRRPQTARRFILFFAAAVIVTGDRTVSAVLRLIALLQPVNPSTFHRLFSHRRWSSDTLAKIIVAFILERFVPKDVVKGIVTIRWVYVIDRDGTHRDECFFATDPSMSPTQIIEMYGGRWNIETTFQEMREHFGLETTRGWSKGTVLRMAPCLFLLYSLVVVFYDTMPHSSPRLRERGWIGKQAVTLSEMIISVRRHLWLEWVFAQVPGGGAVQKLPRPIRRLLDYGLTQAA